MFTLSRLFSFLLGVERTVDFLCGFGWHWLGWELLAFKQWRRMKHDVTYCYTFEFACKEAQMARLALLAGYPEWAWVNADDALAALEWKGEQDDHTYADTVSLRDQAAKKIDVDRLADMAVAQGRAHKDFLSNKTHAFNKYVVSTHPWVMSAAWRGIKRPRIKERLP